MGVHGHIQRADADPKQDKRREQQGKVRCEQRQRQDGAEQQGRGARGGPAAVARGERAATGSEATAPPAIASRASPSRPSDS
jgi:hypothetical protein